MTWIVCLYRNSSTDSLTAGKSRFLLVFCVTVLHGVVLLGQTPRSPNFSIGHDSWTVNDGAPAEVEALAQTTDGFLWLGTPTGLFRFDGVRFVRFRSPFGDQLLTTNVYSLFAPVSGGFWVGYSSGGFGFLNEGRVISYGGETAISSGSVRSFAEDRDGGRLGRNKAADLWRFEHSSWQPIGAEWNLLVGTPKNSGGRRTRDSMDFDVPTRI